MEQVALVPPPIQPKTRRTPPGVSTTVLRASDADCGIIQEAHSQYSISPATSESHVVKILINPQDSVIQNKSETRSVFTETGPSCVRVSVNVDTDMIQKTENFSSKTEQTKPYFFYSPYSFAGTMTSGQVSPSDTLDSGTCSDMDSTPPPLPRKKNNSGVSITVISNQHKRVSSIASSGVDVDSDDNESNVSYDSLNSGDVHPESYQKGSEVIKPSFAIKQETNGKTILPQGLLQDIRDRTVKLIQAETKRLQVREESPYVLGDKDNDNFNENLENNKNGDATESLKANVVDESTYEERKQQERHQEMMRVFNDSNFETDKLIKFHLNEHNSEDESKPVQKLSARDDESFAGFRDYLGIDGAATIRSAKGTIRGVKNRVRAGIATFLQIGATTRSYKEKDAGKVVVYTTTMGIVRETYNNCTKVKKILRTLLVKFEERDVFMSSEYQAEIRDRMRCDHILVPQVFVDGQHIGDADTIERLNETGELRKIMKPYKSIDACTTCKTCGGYRLLPCPICNGSKKSVHRNHFTTEFVALKCMNCDEVGLVRCTSC